MNNKYKFEQQYNEMISLFDYAVKDELEKFLDAQVLSIEKNRLVYDDKLSMLLDCKIGCDLCISQHGIYYFAANRISKVYPDSSAFPPSITLRNSRKGKYENSEIDKLKKLCNLNRNYYFVPMPAVMIFSRVMVENEVSFLLDMVIIKTSVLINFLFDPRAFNLAKLRERFEKEQRSEINYLSYRPMLGGIRTNRYDGNTFVYLSTNLLDTFRVPYVYRKFPHPDSLVEIPEDFDFIIE